MTHFCRTCNLPMSEAESLTHGDSWPEHEIKKGDA